jgi:hypothetical protein
MALNVNGVDITVSNSERLNNILGDQFLQNTGVKTVNGESIVGGGDLTVVGGSGGVPDLFDLSVLDIGSVNTFGSLSGTSKWPGGVLAPNGKIYGIPFDSTGVLEIDPVARTATTFGSFSGTLKWRGGVLAPNGKIYGIPLNSKIGRASCRERV